MLFVCRLATSESNWAVEGAGNTKYYINVCQSLSKVSVGTGCSAFSSVCRTKFDNGQVGV